MFVSSLVYSRRSSSMINIRFSGVASVLRSSAVSWSTTYKFPDYMERDWWAYDQSWSVIEKWIPKRFSLLAARAEVVSFLAFFWRISGKYGWGLCFNGETVLEDWLLTPLI